MKKLFIISFILIIVFLFSNCSRKEEIKIENQQTEKISNVENEILYLLVKNIKQQQYNDTTIQRINEQKEKYNSIYDGRRFFDMFKIDEQVSIAKGIINNLNNLNNIKDIHESVDNYKKEMTKTGIDLNGVEYSKKIFVTD